MLRDNKQYNLQVGVTRLGKSDASVRCTSRPLLVFFLNSKSFGFISVQAFNFF